MRHGYHMGYGFYGAYFLIIICILIILLLILTFKKENKSLNPFFLRLLDILKEKYAVGEITADEYIKRKSIIEDTQFSTPYTLILLERYANCEIDSKEFFELRNEIESKKYNDDLNDKLAKGELSIEDCKSKTRD